MSAPDGWDDLDGDDALNEHIAHSSQLDIAMCSWQGQMKSLAAYRPVFLNTVSLRHQFLVTRAGSGKDHRIVTAFLDKAANVKSQLATFCGQQGPQLLSWPADDASVGHA